MERITLLTFRTVNYLLDLVLLSTAFLLGVVAWWARSTATYKLSELSELDWQRLAVTFLLFYLGNFCYLVYSGVYRMSRLQALSLAISQYARAACLSTVFVAVVGVFLPFVPTSRTLLLFMFLVSFVLYAGKELVVRWVLTHLREQGKYVRRALIVGADKELVERIVDETLNDDLLGIDISGVVYPELGVAPEQFADELPVPLVGDIRNLIEILEQHHPDLLILFGRDIEPDIMEEALWVCEERGLESWIKLDILDRVIYQAQLHSLEGIPFITLQGGPSSPAAMLLKHTFDRLVSAVLLVLVSPLLLLIIVLIRLTSPGPVFFRQLRAGLNGRPFEVLKFRSMIVDAEAHKDSLQDQNEMMGPVFKIAKDPRITPIGRVLRKTSLDELPQLWNVFRGEMSLVGPRPLPIEEAEMLHGWHRRRLSMKPGITCIWQVAGRNEIREFDDWAHMDLEYIDNWSLWLDFVILLQTVPVVIFGRGAS